MPNVASSQFPTMGEVCNLARSIVNDRFPGIGGQSGRILTNNAPFTLDYLNSAFRWLQRRLRNEGVTFPINDYFIIHGIPPVAVVDPGVFVYIGYDGYFDGQQMHGNIKLPSNLVQPIRLRQRLTGSNLEFVDMGEPQQGLPSGYQNQWFGGWEWRNYQIWMNGSLQTQDLMLRFTTGQPQMAAPPADFDATPIYIMDSTDALANYVAKLYGGARGANAEQIAEVKADAESAVDEMALEYVRRAQEVQYRRGPYRGGGSNTSGNTSLGSTGTVG